MCCSDNGAPHQEANSALSNIFTCKPIGQNSQSWTRLRWCLDVSQPAHDFASADLVGLQEMIADRLAAAVTRADLE